MFSDNNSESSKNPEKSDFSDRKSDLGRKMESDHDGGGSNGSKNGNLSSQELTLSYLCGNLKMGIEEKEASGKNLLCSLEKGGSSKGKEVAFDSGNEDERWVERDFLQLNGVCSGGAGGSKREIGDEGDKNLGKEEKKAKLETLNLSLGLPDVSLSLASPNRIPRCDPQGAGAGAGAALKPSRSTQSLAPSNNMTRTGSSDDFTGAASMSYSYSHPFSFSHNPSCSLTRNSTDFYEYNCGEGTNGSVHSRFKPVGDGVVLANYQGGVGNSSMQGNWPMSKEPASSLYRAAGSENISFFPSDLPARPVKDTQSNDSRGRASDRHWVGSDAGARARKLLREVVSESISIMAQIFQELPDETIESTKEYLKCLIGAPEKSEELSSFQRRVKRRSDFTFESLSKTHKAQLEILVAIKTGLAVYLSGKTRLPTTELIEIFLFLRCRNITCKGLLPVDDCDCKICSTTKGFCSACMCPVCLKFDCASKTCSWVGCDVCSHWCHAVCGLRKNLIKPGRSLKSSTGATEMQFHCPGCDHASEMFGFVKDVFVYCAEEWGLETLKKEIDYVRQIFKGSEDSKGKELHNRAEQMLGRLETKTIAPSDATNCILQFFKYGIQEFSGSAGSTKDVVVVPQMSQKGIIISASPSTSQAAKSTPYSLHASSGQREMLSLRDDSHPKKIKSLMTDHDSTPYSLHASNGQREMLSLRDESHQNKIKSIITDRDSHQNKLKSLMTDHDSHQNKLKSLMTDQTAEEELQNSILSKNGFNSLESIIRIKEAEARMFQNKADDARREAERFRRMVRASSEKLEEEYTTKLAKLCLQETEERRRKKLEELKTLENSHCDYYNMKIRMQSEIEGLLERMEATKQQCVQ